MRVLIVAIGSRGDVAPYTGLAKRLRADGYDVRIATHPPYEQFVRGVGATFLPLPMDPRAELDPETAHKIAGNSPMALRALAKVLEPWVPALVDAIDDAADDADVLLLSSMGWVGKYAADARRLPSAGVYLQPAEPTSEFGPVTSGRRTLARAGNRLMSGRIQRHTVSPWIDAANGLRDKHGMSKISVRQHLQGLRRERWPVFHGFSPSILPRPTDWRPGLEVAGYWWPTVPPGSTTPPELVDFLEAGPPPVFIGFGDSTPRDPEELTAIAVGALRQSGQRGVLQAGWAGMAAATDDVVTVGDVPHEWLFPQMSAVVHHGGTGTSGAGIRAGRPVVTVPVSVDQQFWGWRMHRLGLGPEPVPAADLDADRLSGAITAAVSVRGHARQAATYQRLVSSEDGAGVVSRWLAGQQRSAI